MQLQVALATPVAAKQFHLILLLLLARAPRRPSSGRRLSLSHVLSAMRDAGTTYVDAKQSEHKGNDDLVNEERLSKQSRQAKQAGTVSVLKLSGLMMLVCQCDSHLGPYVNNSKQQRKCFASFAAVLPFLQHYEKSTALLQSTAITTP